MVIDGSNLEAVRHALRTRAALSGADGFAGELNGQLVRDVCGRYPLFSERGDSAHWSFDPRDLVDPDPVQAGHVRGDNGDKQVWTLPDPERYNEADHAVEVLKEAVVDSVDEIDTDPAVAFSGGLDSSILAARLDGPLYVGGFEGSTDIDAARSAADALGRDLRVIEFTNRDIERGIPKVVNAIGRTDPMDVQIALSLFLVGRSVASDGYDRLALGQGADELFGGYAKIENAAEDDHVEATTVRGAVRETIETLPRQLERDVLALRAAGVEPVVPLCTDRVIDVALRLPEELLVSGGERKVALRRAADFLPDGIRSREKKAIQYGSLLGREFDRLARQAGFKRRMDNHLGQYIDSLV